MNVMQIMAGPDMIRTNPAQSGTAPLTPVFPSQNKESSSVKKTGTFESYLLEAVNTVN